MATLFSSNRQSSLPNCRCTAPVVLSFILIVALLSGGQIARSQSPAQVSWEYSPYDLQIWFAFGPAPELAASIRKALPNQLVDESWARVGAPWKLRITNAPATLSDTMLSVMGGLDADQIEAAAGDDIGADKIMLVAIDHHHDRFQVTAREFDIRTRVLGRVAIRSGRDLTSLPSVTIDAVLAAFAPLVRVERSEGKEALIRVRAGGLIVEPNAMGMLNPVAVRRNSLLQPVLRRNDRYGKPKRIDVIEWTYLRVDHAEGNLFQCEIRSALRNPLAGRGSSRSIKLALGVTPEGTRTKLKLVTLVADRLDGKDILVPVPMEGYEIFAKNPLPAEDGELPKAIPLGRTDWKGMIEIERDPDYPLRLIYVKNGRFLLARLPLIPGLDQETLADLTSDDQRLQVEAFVRGVEANVMDIVARRQILATRIRRRINEGKMKAANELMEEFSTLPGQDVLEQMIGARRTKVSSPDPRERRRIDAMLIGVQMLIRRFLDDGLEAQLRDELQPGGATPAAAATADKSKASKKKTSGKKKKGKAK